MSLSAASVAFASEADSSRCLPVPVVGKENCVFTEGEILKFSVSYKWGLINSRVASATVSLSEVSSPQGELFHCVAQGRTERFYDKLFRVREHFESWFRCDNLRPVRFVRDTREGRYIARNEYVWDHQTDSIKADVYSSSKGQRYLTLPGRECTFDLVSLFYFARTMNFSEYEENVRYPISFAIDDEIYDLYFIILGKETIDLKKTGTFNTLKFAVRLVAGEVFTGNEDMYVWVTDDTNRVPVYFEAPILVGFVYGQIDGWENLKYPLVSKIK